MPLPLPLPLPLPPPSSSAAAATVLRGEAGLLPGELPVAVDVHGVEYRRWHAGQRRLHLVTAECSVAVRVGAGEAVEQPGQTS